MKANLFLGILAGLVILFLLALIGWRSGFAVKDFEPSEGLTINQISDPKSPSIKTSGLPVDSSKSSSKSSGKSSGDSDDCDDDCSLGEKRCVGEYAQKCGDYDSDDCLEWEENNLCEFGCQNGVCLGGQVILNIGFYEAQKGETFTLPVSINTLEEVYAAHLEIEFDPLILQVKEIKEKYLNEENTYVIEKGSLDNSEGRIRYVSTIIGEQKGVSGLGELIEIEFVAIEEGESSLNFIKTEILNSELEYMVVETSEGNVVVN
ncbi:MAG: cohesin domain-containing protein [Candidatus Pacearchaeota archaeon]